jgi:hypothetical protein
MDNLNINVKSGGGDVQIIANETTPKTNQELGEKQTKKVLDIDGETEKDILHYLNRRMFEQGAISEELFTKAKRSIERL